MAQAVFGGGGFTAGGEAEAACFGAWWWWAQILEDSGANSDAVNGLAGLSFFVGGGG